MNGPQVGSEMSAPELLKVTLARDNLFIWLLAVLFMGLGSLFLTVRAAW